ncbi:hypothetical protein MP638_000135 [Amoeboaphelidium occidentale]|nr:hypothetical protein MP638_000135 [Amoeboaphelidium occidentale]
MTHASNSGVCWPPVLKHASSRFWNDFCLFLKSTEMADPLDDLDKKLENLTINELPQHFEGPDYIRALERKVQLIEEKSKKVEQKAAEEVQKVKDEGFHGKILTEGFPPLDSGPLHSTQSQAQKKTVQFELSTEEINLPMFDSYILKKRNSLLWQIPRDWRGETAIKRLVAFAVQDCINSTPGCENLKVLEEVIFVNADTGTKDRVDLAITRSPQTSVVVGAIEVKKPPTETQEKNGKEFDMNNAGPLIQYMYDLRSNHGVRFVFGILTTSNHGVRFVFGILTTYVKWRFFWLDDSSEAMLCEDLDEYKEMCTDSPLNSPIEGEASKPVRDAKIMNKANVEMSRVYNYNDKELVPAMLCEDLDEYKEMCSDSPLISPIEGEASKPVRDAKIMNKANVEMSRVYNYNDKELVPVLCMLLRKWQLVPCDRVNGFLHENRLYQVVKNEQKACGFSTLPAKLKQFSYEFPPSGNTSIYYILHTYKRSGDGKVALCTASAEKETVGLIGVVKFFINDSGKKAEELMALHEQEL